jgi:hypothetical protein
VDHNFWNVFFLLLIYIPLLLIWGFSILDIFRRDDIGGVNKAIWLIVVILIPLLGTFLYLIFRRPGATAEERAELQEASREFVQRYASTSPADQLRVLAELHDKGKLTDDEFSREKAHVLATH